MKKIKLTFIIPTFNEGEIIKDTLKDLYESMKENNVEPEVIIIDDSKDNTVQILEELKKQYKGLRVIHRDNSTGVGSAIRLGLEESKGDYSVIYMGDYRKKDLECVPEMLKRMNEGYDIIQTSRFMKGMTIKGYPLKKTIGNRMCNYFIRLTFLNFKLKDYTSLYKAIKTDKIKELELESDWFDLGTEMVLKGLRRRYKIVEVPVSWEERVAGESKLKLSKFAPKYFKRVIGILFTYWPKMN